MFISLISLFIVRLLPQSGLAQLQGWLTKPTQIRDRNELPKTMRFTRTVTLSVYIPCEDERIDHQ